MDYLLQQKDLCDKYSVPCVACGPNEIVGIAKNVVSGLKPINALRHAIENDTSGWYIWAGEQFYETDNFFQPMHVKHLHDINPDMIKFLGLPPGYRFLIDDNGMKMSGRTYAY